MVTTYNSTLCFKLKHAMGGMFLENYQSNKNSLLDSMNSVLLFRVAIW